MKYLAGLIILFVGLCLPLTAFAQRCGGTLGYTLRDDSGELSTPSHFIVGYKNYQVEKNSIIFRMGCYSGSIYLPIKYQNKVMFLIFENFHMEANVNIDSLPFKEGIYKVDLNKYFSDKVLANKWKQVSDKIDLNLLSKDLSVPNTELLILAALIDDEIQIDNLFQQMNKEYILRSLEALIQSGTTRQINPLLLRLKGDAHTLANFLNSAAQYRNLDAIKLLLDAGADPNGDKQPGPLFYAATTFYNSEFAHNTTPIEMLIGAGAKVNIKNQNGQTPLFNAAQSFNNEAIKVLIEAGAEINVKDCNNETPLLLAAHFGNKDGVALLMTAGANEFSRTQALKRALKNLNESTLESYREVYQKIVNLLLEGSE